MKCKKCKQKLTECWAQFTCEYWYGEYFVEEKKFLNINEAENYGKKIDATHFIALQGCTNREVYRRVLNEKGIKINNQNGNGNGNDKENGK